MRSLYHCLLILTVFCATVWLGTNIVLAQDSLAEFENILRDKASFEETDFSGLELGQAVVRLLPPTDRREVAVCGLVKLNVPAEQFVESFRESMTHKVTPAILEIGRFSDGPTAADLQTLTIEDRDLEDLKNCVAGDCKVKLSAKMIERFQHEVDWEAPNYRMQATQLLKQMLLDYVRDYLVRGEVALIKYSDKLKEVSLAEEQRTLMDESTYLNGVLRGFQRELTSARKPGLTVVDNAIVWSKIKFGLKPVVVISHIVVYMLDKEAGPQVLITSKQIYASHYFDSSFALTALVSIPGASGGTYLIYENRSRADGLGGLFGKMKRDIVENKAVDNLKSILESSKTSLNARSMSPNESTTPVDKERGWKGWKVRRVQVFLCLLLITALVALFTIGSYSWRNGFSGESS